MKKYIILILAIISMIYVFTGVKAEDTIIPDEAIRFRVIANSNTIYDQNIKVQLKNVVQNKIFELTKGTETIEETRKILKDNIDLLDNLTKETDIERDGYTDTYYAAISDMDDNTDYKMLVDEYFNTKFSTQCDYSLAHFSSEKVLTNIMNHVCKSSWCESKEW